MPKKGCSECLSVPFRRTLGLTLRFQNKNTPMSRDGAARLFPVCHFLLHTHHSQLSLSGLHLWVHQRRHTPYPFSLLSKRAQEESQTPSVSDLLKTLLRPFFTQQTAVTQDRPGEPHACCCPVTHCQLFHGALGQPWTGSVPFVTPDL